ncbi:MAG: hypothetical protein ACREMA_14630, partial [Longimicrobiales bacterium]
VYGQSLAWTWHWLVDTAGPSLQIDLGAEAVDDRLRAVTQETIERMLAPRVVAPVLLPKYVDLWSQTSPAPGLEPDIAAFLHGPTRGSADVQVVWRADIEASWLSDASPRPLERALTDILGSCPPSSLEAMSVPIAAVRAWLAARLSESTKRTEVTVADVEGAEDAEEESRDAEQRIAPAVVWANDQAHMITRADEVVPGATIVVPATYGGIGQGNWDPTATSPSVSDRGDEAQLLHRGRAIMRWHTRVFDSWNADRAGPRIEDGEQEEPSRGDEWEAYDSWAADTLQHGVPDWASVAIHATLQARRRIVRVAIPKHEGPGQAPVIWRASIAVRRISRARLKELRQRHREVRLEGLECATDTDAATSSGNAIELEVHLNDVTDYARQFATHVGLEDRLLEDVVLAAATHDIGKIDPRFQLWLHEGDQVRRAMAVNPLAKSGTPPGDHGARRRAQLLSG